MVHFTSPFRKTKSTTSPTPAPTNQAPTIASKTSNQSNCSKNSNDKQPSDDMSTEAKFPKLGYEYLHGRQYKQQSGVTHILPCDDEETERQEVLHLLHKYLFGTYLNAPVGDILKQGGRVLQICCGPAYWTKEVAKVYPNSEFFGIDDVIYPITSPPNNCHFQIIDSTKDLPFEDNTFDLVVQHEARFKHTKEVWEKVVREAIRVTKPGGYLEFKVNDIGPSLSLWLMRLSVLMQTRHMINKIGLELEELFVDTNQVTIYESIHRSAPLGWLGRVGDLVLDCLQRVSDALKPRLCEDWSMSITKYDAHFKTVLPECQEFKSWSNFYCVVSQKKQELIAATDDNKMNDLVLAMDTTKV
ncbi:S-adenosyl-L-methionine-dependent methyltransferase [Chlamydoabsidia padenii]|nr:S-adenosyl-L-methionine-dependent methyltransferase [Chlamydoabsidia padenii]